MRTEWTAPVLCWLRWWVCAFRASTAVAAAVEGTCGPGDFEYHYTECDARGERWRFAVPKSHAGRNCAASAPPPQPGLNCSFICPAGHYLDLENQECRQCRPGMYSLGDGVRYEHLKEMPHGFTVENFPDETDQFLAEGGDGDGGASTSVECSNRVGWVVQNGELRYLPTPCVSKLSMSLNLIHDGYIQFYYKMPKNGRSLLSILQVRNAFCQSYGDTRGMFLHSLGHLARTTASGGDIGPLSAPSNGSASAVAAGEFQTKRIPVRAGQNLLTWTVANNRELTTLADIIHVATIDIVGLAFTPVCSSCPEGTYSLSGAQKCTICGAGTFSPPGASFCRKCQPNEYSGPKAAKCQRRPTCESYDYYTVLDAHCSTSPNGARRPAAASRQVRVEPHICEEITPPLVPSELTECPPCRAGMQRSPSTGLCEYCKEDEYSPDGQKCIKCPSNAIPTHGFYFNRWDVLPAEVTTSCEYLFAGQAECTFTPSWIPLGDRVESSPTRARGVALSLGVEVVTGFYNPLRTGGMSSRASTENPIAQLALDFEVICADHSCQLYLVQEQLNTTGNSGNVGSPPFTIIAALNGTRKRTTLTYPIVDDRPTRFVLAFMRSRVELEADVVRDRAVVYTMNISHVGDAAAHRSVGGGRDCVPCPARDPTTNQCQPCPMGHYLSEQNTCTKCPFGTALNMTSSLRGAKSCVRCGDNLGSDDGTECTFSGRFHLNSTMDDGTWKLVQFDVSRLKDRVLKADGIRVFAREGNSYFHSFNVSLFGKPVRCRDTFDSNGVIFPRPVPAVPSSQPYEENILFCRAAALPSMVPMVSQAGANSSGVNKVAKSAEDMVYVSSIAIGRKIAAVTQNRTFRGFHLSNDQLDYDSSLSSTIRPTDMHIFYEPLPTRLPSCPLGTLGAVTLRCELTAVDNPIVRLSRKCPDGTCDGCLYHVIVETSLACPICHPDDFEEIRGECVNNLQKIHYIPSKHCVLSGAQNRERTEACSTVSDKVFLLLLLAALIITCLVIAVLVIYEKNKSLEYRYMRIVEGKDMDDLNSCALKSDDEDEEDAADQKDASKTRVFFQKKKDHYKVTLNNTKDNKRPKLTGTEMSQFLSESSDDG